MQYTWRTPPLAAMLTAVALALDELIADLSQCVTDQGSLMFTGWIPH